MSVDWDLVADRLDRFAAAAPWHEGTGETKGFKPGQRDALAALAERVRNGQRSLLLADEVGMGKTLIAVAFIKAVQECGGRSVVVLPPGLGGQWRSELRRIDPEDQTLLPLRSFRTFVDAYGWGSNGRPQRLADRRLQREWPTGTWAEEKIILLSHNLANVKKTDGTIPWYFGLGQNAIKVLAGRRRYVRADDHATEATRTVAEKITACLSAAEQRTLSEELKSTGDQMDRSWLTMGRGLGRFDLVVIDEAHKARGTDTSLGRVLGRITWKSPDVFRFGMTATPVELGAWQWIDTLDRLAVDKHTLVELRSVIDRYVEAVSRLQHSEALTDDSVGRFSTVAREFQQRLSPWVLRRDKREDEFLRAFVDKHGSHRDISPVHVSLADMPLDWKRAFVAGEALSLMSEQELGPLERRLRLSLPDGHGLVEVDAVLDTETALTETDARPSPWLSLASAVSQGGSAALIAHPAIRHAVEEIERAVADGEKVLVFGRYIRPMRALTALLDAREMVRRLCREDAPENRWPQSSIANSDVFRSLALASALEDLSVNVTRLDVTSVTELLATRARGYANARRGNLEAARSALEHRADRENEAAGLLALWNAEGTSDAATSGALLCALDDQRPVAERYQPWDDHSLISAYRRLRTEVANGNEDDDANDDFRNRLSVHLEDFRGRDGHFARLMYGATAAQTRGLLQASFNREGSWPQVLVAQSTVGREGLNLQTACRTIVMLHLEWNPAHAEQQIGRVDRIESRWIKEAELFETTGVGIVPKICVRPIVVSGTYDDHHWAVLRGRWDSMRAQLNGDVLPDIDIDDTDPERRDLVLKARAAGPDFSPPRVRRI